MGRQAIGPDNPKTLEVVHEASKFYLEQKRYDDAEPLMNRAVAGPQPGSTGVSQSVFGSS